MASAYRLTHGSRIECEAALADAWEHGDFPAHGLVDSLGRHLRLIFPGRRWGGPGPDFRGAALALPDGQVVRGDVEVHVRASGWARHAHAADPEYARVVLHVVAIDDAPTLDALGAPIPTLVLIPNSPRIGPPARPFPHPCLTNREAIVRVVAEAGRRRFEARVAGIGREIEVFGADEVVWRRLLRALGYSRNSRQFARLAEAVPWRQAAEVAQELGPVALTGLLSGMAGLVGELSTLAEAHAWRRFERQRIARPVLAAAEWDTRMLRAGNIPVARFRGAADLALRWTADESRSPAQVTLNAVRLASGRRHPALWRVAAASPWIGRGRAQIIAINVLLPAAAALGAREAHEVYERLPGEPSNRILRYMASQLDPQHGRGTFPRACLQQGLLAVFRATCAERACDRCPAAAHHGAIEGMNGSTG